MGSSSIGEATGATGWSEPEKERIRVQLAKVLISPHFRSSKRCSLLLSFVVENAIENRLAAKERTLGIEVFKRDPDYDTGLDPVVRSTAGEVRKRLAQYYLEPRHELEPRISLPPGAYTPEIDFHPQETQVVTHPAPARRFLPQKAWLAVAGVGVAAAVVYGALTLRRTALDQFWDPVLAAPGPVLICVGQPRTYGFLSPLQGHIEAWFARRGENETPPPELA